MFAKRNLKMNNQKFHISDFSFPILIGKNGLSWL